MKEKLAPISADPNATVFQESGSLAKAYDGIAYDSPALLEFHREILSTLVAYIEFSPQTSLLDIGCGKGYFLKYLQEAGFPDVHGLEPSASMRSDALSAAICPGSFEANTIPDHAFDVVFTCHTLHHLPKPWPHHAIHEMIRMTKKYLVVVEINNTNFPMYFRSLLLFKQEVNAFRYNKQRVNTLLTTAGCPIRYNKNMRASYLSSTSWIYRILSKIGHPPYNISIAEFVR